MPLPAPDYSRLRHYPSTVIPGEQSGVIEAVECAAAPVLHIEPVESFRLRHEWPWPFLAFGSGLPLLTVGVLGARSGWADWLVVALIAGAVALLLGCLRAGVRQEARRDAAARAAYRALPTGMLARATMSASLSERTRSLIANLLARRDPDWANDLETADEAWAALKRAGPPNPCGQGCCGPVPPRGGFRAETVPTSPRDQAAAPRSFPDPGAAQRWPRG